MIFILCPKESGRDKYWDWDKYNRIEGLWKTNPLLEAREHRYRFRKNASRLYKNGVIACTDNHLSILQMIVDQKINNVYIGEDDIEIDENRLKDISDNLKQDGITWLCYNLKPPLIKDWGKVDVSDLLVRTEGIHEKPNNLFFGSAGLYYIPNWKVAEKILQNIYTKSGNYLISNMIDIILNKVVNIKKYYVYPPVGWERIGLPSTLYKKINNESSSVRI